jgi:hypothetical protein
MHKTTRYKKDFNPSTFVDREREQELFEGLLTFGDAARVLAVSDRSGMGKSQLLESFQHRCRITRPRIAVSQVDFKQLPHQSPLVIIREIVDDLKRLGVPFPTFTRADSARVSSDFRSIRMLHERMYMTPPRAARRSPQRRDSFTRYEQGLKRLRDRVGSGTDMGTGHPRMLELLTLEQRLQDNIAQFRQAGDTDTRRSERVEIIRELNRFALSITANETSFNDLCPPDEMLHEMLPDSFSVDDIAMPVPATAAASFTPEQERFAQDACLEAFATDLRAYCAEHPLVLLVDSYEYCDSTTSAWMHDYFLEHYFFDLDKRPHYLLLVIAGQQVPPFESFLSPDDYEQIVRSVQLGRWSRQHVKQFLQVHERPHDEKVVEAVYCFIEQGVPLSHLTMVIESMGVQQG